MGATWHNRCMFDLDTVEDSFADILQHNCIETYTFDYVGTGPGIKTEFIGDHNIETINTAIQLVQDNNIEYVVGYSYGCMIAREIISQCPSLKGLILIDPQSEIYMDVVPIDDGDKLKLTKAAIASALKNHHSTISTEIQKDYIDKTADSDSLITAFYPRTFYRNNSVFFKTKEHVDELYSLIQVKTFFTKNTIETVRKLYPNSTHMSTSSHWILLEEGRFELANEIINFIDLTINQ